MKRAPLALTLLSLVALPCFYTPAGAANTSAAATEKPAQKPERPKPERHGHDLPDYPMGARIALGRMQIYKTGEEDTLLDIARHFRLGFVELRAANPDIDPWAPLPDTPVVIPSFHLLPRARQQGIVVNLAEMRMYHFKTPGAAPETYPLGIGREGLQTPVGETRVVRKKAAPSWYPTPRMREESPWLPESVPPGPENPLGTHALYLGWPSFLIHGSNKPWAIGRRVSSGCMRMYPEDIARLFENVPVGTPVTTVEQPVLAGWVDDTFYVEAIPTRSQSDALEIEGAFDPVPLDDASRELIATAAGPAASRIDWGKVETVLLERRGYPVAIMQAQQAPAPRARTRAHTYN